MRTAISYKTLDEFGHRLWLQAEHARMHAALEPLVNLFGSEKYLEWVDAWITDDMTVDQIIALAQSFYPECTCTPELQPCPGCREWARARARLAGATEDDLPYED